MAEHILKTAYFYRAPRVVDNRRPMLANKTNVPAGISAGISALRARVKPGLPPACLKSPFSAYAWFKRHITKARAGGHA